MSKTALASLIAEKHGLTKAKSEEIVETMLDGIKNTLISQGSVSFIGFGRFSVNERAARLGRNPSNGEKVEVPAQRVVKFTPGAPLKKAVNPDK